MTARVSHWAIFSTCPGAAAFGRKRRHRNLAHYAFDGSKYTLPATPELRKAIDPDSGLDQPGKGHYPQALVNTVYDVFRRLPVGRSVCPVPDGDERKQALSLLAKLPLACVCLFDRGHPRYAFILALLQQSRLFLMRCPAKSTFPAVESFVHGGQAEDWAWLMPSDEFKRGLTRQERETLQPIKRRIIRLTRPDGTGSALLTNLFDKTAFPRPRIIDLYYRRWAVENHYRDEKVGFEIEHFHSRTANGIQQVNSVKALIVFQDLLDDIRRVKYYRPKKRQASKPRVNKGSLNKW